MIFFLKRAFYFVIDHWHIFAIGLAVLITVIFVYRACHKTPTIDQAAINKINSANEKERKAELQKVIEDNADIVKTVDDRVAITDVNVVERNAQIDAKIKDADRQILEAKQDGRDVTAAELECILIPANCK